MIMQNIDRLLEQQHSASKALQIPLRKAAHVEEMDTGASRPKAPMGSQSGGRSSYTQPRASKNPLG